jgi:hypothetical protein
VQVWIARLGQDLNSFTAIALDQFLDHLSINHSRVQLDR